MLFYKLDEWIEKIIGVDDQSNSSSEYNLSNHKNISQIINDPEPKLINSNAFSI
jgi:hypothetical protein